jgi:hypothetical protein
MAMAMATATATTKKMLACPSPHAIETSGSFRLLSEKTAREI